MTSTIKSKIGVTRYYPVPKDMAEGSVHPSNEHGDVSIICYHSSLNVEFKFINTGHVSSARSYDVRKGSLRDSTIGIKTPADMKKGKVYVGKKTIKIVNYINASKVVVKDVSTGDEFTTQAWWIRNSFKVKK